MEQLKKIDIGTVHEIDPDYLEGLKTENSVNGAYRDLRQYLPTLAKFYLSKNIKESLKGFTESTGTFQIWMDAHLARMRAYVLFWSVSSMLEEGWHQVMITF